LNPATEATFDLLRGLFADITGGVRGSGLFPDNMMHLGGDEVGWIVLQSINECNASLRLTRLQVNTKCWSDTPSIAAWMTSKGFSADQSYEYFVQRAQGIAHSQGRDVVGWEEIWNHFGTQLDPSTIIHQWLPGSTVAKNCTSHGYRVLWSTDGVWYLDGLDTTWQTMYAQEPCTGIDPVICSKLVLGGGGEMWGETVDASDLISTVWPRAAAIAERLWSPQSVTDIDAAAPRFSAFRCLLNKRGFGAAPSNNKVARSSPPSPGGCFSQ
jgi:hexosaminidase